MHIRLFVLVLLFSVPNLVRSRFSFDEPAENSVLIQDLDKEFLPALQHDQHHPEEGNIESENELSPDAKPNNETESSSSSYVIQLLSKAFRFLNLRRMVKNVQQGRSTPGACIACKFAINMVRYLIDNGKGFNDVAYVSTYLCKSFNVQTPRVCEGYVNNFMEEFVVAISNSPLSSNEICGTMLGDSCSEIDKSLKNWTLPIPHRRSRYLLGAFFNKYIKKRKPLKVLQISDIHLDLEYSEGSNAVCGEPLCCRSSSPGSGEQLSPERKAGYWGDYRDCDIPLHTVEETFRAIRDNHPDIDYIIWTGDIPPHDIWNQTKESQLKLIDIVDNLFQQYFDGIPIFPVVGNHETLPMNSFPQPFLTKNKNYTKFSKNWLYEKLSESWSHFLPIETQATIERGAYYATRAKPGLKIISLNTNFCNNQNWWILLNITDPGQQLEWLIQQLTKAREMGEKVHILGHVPPGSNDCVQIWSLHYNRIINEFKSTVKGQFFGHTHNDEFELFYRDESPNSPYDKQYEVTNVAYIGPSITTFGNVNPGYRIYSVDAKSFDILDHHTYFMNLTEANLHRNSRPVKFTKSYSAKEAYGLHDLDPSSWHHLVQRMKTPIKSEERTDGKAEQADELFRMFYRYFHNRSDNIGENKCEDESCKYEILCRLLTAYSHDTTICRHFLMST